MRKPLLFALLLSAACLLLLSPAGCAGDDPAADEPSGGGSGGSSHPAAAGGGAGGVAVGGAGGVAGAGTGGGGAPQADGGNGPDAPREAAPVHVGTCDGLGTVGQWEQITPPDVPLPGPFPCDFGVLAFVVDPINLGTVYLGTCEFGIRKTTDCGATWTHVNTGTNGSVLDHSRQWTFVIDPIDPRILYTNAGYPTDGESPAGALKSTNGGVSWQWIWPSADPSQAGILNRDFVSQINMDPTNRQHLVMGFHGCKPPLGVACFGETKDGGATWTIQNGDPSWESSESQTPYAVNDHILLFDNHDSTSSRWVSTNSGQSWSMIEKDSAGHWPAQLYQAAGGYYYMGNNQGVMRSADGATWAQIPSYKGGMVTGLVGDGTTMWAANWGSYTAWVPEGTNPYVSSKETDGLMWTAAAWTTPAGFKFTQGGLLGYDPAHHLLYSSNGTQGFWRVLTQ